MSPVGLQPARAYVGSSVWRDDCTPDHSTLTNAPNRLPRQALDKMFPIVPSIDVDKQLHFRSTAGADGAILEVKHLDQAVVASRAA